MTNGPKHGATTPTRLRCSQRPQLGTSIPTAFSQNMYTVSFSVTVRLFFGSRIHLSPTRKNDERVFRCRAVSSKSPGNSTADEIVEISVSELQANRPSPRQVTFKRSVELDEVQSLSEGVQKLKESLDCHLDLLSSYPDGILRLEVTLPGTECPLSWLRRQVSLRSQHLSFYFSPRGKSVQDSDRSLAAESVIGTQGAISSIGTSWVWKGDPGVELGLGLFDEIMSFLDPNFPNIQCFGMSRFDCAQTPCTEWESFGSYLFFIPAIEYRQASQNSILACNVTWKMQKDDWNFGQGPSTLKQSISETLAILDSISTASMPHPIPPNIQK